MDEESHQHLATNSQKIPQGNQGYIVYRENRVPVKIPDNETAYQIFTPADLPNDEKAKVTGMHVTIKPNQWATEKLIKHQTADEVVFITKGQLRFMIDGSAYNVQAGDSCYIPKGTWHNYLNLSSDQDAECIAIFTELIY